MTYDLVLGDYAYSSWSLRGWLLFEKFDLPRQLRMVDFSTQDVADQIQDFAPAQTVPTMRASDGAIVSDSLAMAEELASRHPNAGIWPTDPKLRATARSLTAEMHSSFMALRSECPMGVRIAYDWSDPSDAVRTDLKRLETLWSHAQDVSGNGPWLFGDYCAADAFFAPVAARIAGYSLPVNDAAQAYVQTHLNDLAFRRWRAMGMVSGKTLPWYAQSHPQVPWPGPVPKAAKATDRNDSENTACPYSGKPVTHFLELDGRVFGFCNALCRDKTVSDPEAWPAFVSLL